MIFRYLRPLPELSPQMFTYFIPAPPPRKTGYRERTLDIIFSQIAALGGKNFKWTSEVLSVPNGGGMWVILYYECPSSCRETINEAIEKELDSLFKEDDPERERLLEEFDPIE
ncbi:MAG: hypothetical protein OXB88_09615 [Bacteriovoracales bacterium]|nr:hypothetical protein [Bacteriovoracales bacterium]